jgi:hypothetical protein
MRRSEVAVLEAGEVKCVTLAATCEVGLSLVVVELIFLCEHANVRLLDGPDSI